MIKLRSGAIDRRILAGVAILATIVGGLLHFGMGQNSDDQPRRPDLLIMSSIPLQWGEATMAQIAKGETQPSPLFIALAKKSRPVLIDDFQKLGRPGNAPLLLIQPRALAPSELVQLDDWVRKGGTAIIFADPALDWPSDRPLGDQRRPLFTSLLNPLFRHWGVELALPVAEQPKAMATTAGDFALSLKSPGILVLPKNAKATARCEIRPDEFMAYCAVGKGRALLVADVDTLQDAQWTDGVMTPGTMAWLQNVIDVSRDKATFPDHLWEIEGN
jgi:hypothetical protein